MSLATPSSSTLDFSGMAKWNPDDSLQFSDRSDLTSHSPSPSSASQTIKALNPSSSLPLAREQPSFFTPANSSASNPPPLLIPNLHALKQQLHQSIAMNPVTLPSMPSPRLPLSTTHLHPHPHLCSHKHPPLPSSCCSYSSLSPSTPPSLSPSSSSFDHGASLLSLRIQLQRQALAAARTAKLRNSPLSPQESSTAKCFSDSSAQPTFSLASSIVEALKHSPIPVQTDSSLPHVPASFSVDSMPLQYAQLSDLPIVRGPCTFKAFPAATKIAPAPTSFLSDNRSYQSEDNSKRFKRTLEDLERELLGDDEADIDTSTTFDAQLSSIIATSDPHDQEPDWTDVIEDLLCTESSSWPTPSTLDRSTVTCTSSKKNEASAVTISVSSCDSSAHLRDLLLSCASALNESDLLTAMSKILCLEQSVSSSGDPMQRLATYMLCGLASRIERLQGIRTRSSKLKEPSSPEIMKATHLLYHVCPYFQFGFLAANGVIAEVFKNEAEIHIVDFDIQQSDQWEAVIRAFGQRPGGAPHLRITGVADPKFSTNLEGVGKRLHEIAMMAGVPFEFHALATDASHVEPWMLQRKPNEALAVNFAFQLHHMPDESVNTSNPRDRLLRMMRSLDPKVVTLVEFELNTNTAPFYPRFVETLNYFGAVFESLDGSFPRDSKERESVEQCCLALQIVNIIACEGAERVERYEVEGKWRARMTMAGFRPLPLSSCITRTTKESLQHCSPSYKIREASGALFLDCLERGLVFASAWQ